MNSSFTSLPPYAVTAKLPAKWVRRSLQAHLPRIHDVRRASPLLAGCTSTIRKLLVRYRVPAMADSSNEKVMDTVPSVEMGKGDTSSIDEDAMKLAEMGYTQEMQRNFSVWSVLGVGFSLTNSWFGVSAALVTGINSGGPMLIIYGIILIALVSTGVGITLSELASAMPNAGGQYFWANELAPKRWAKIASYLTGWFAWAGAIFTSASVALAMGSAMVGCYQLSHPDL
jgi:choline transport protein